MGLVANKMKGSTAEKTAGNRTLFITGQNVPSCSFGPRQEANCCNISGDQGGLLACNRVTVLTDWQAVASRRGYDGYTIHD